MNSPTSDEYHYLLEKSIFLTFSNDIYIYQNNFMSHTLIIENIMDLVG